MGGLFHVARQYLDQQFKAFGLSRPEWLILALLRVHEGKISQAYAKTYIGLEISYFTKTLNRLEKNGYIYREIDPNDRRNRIIKLNSNAPKSLKKIFNIIYELNEKILSDLNKKEIANLHDYMERISKKLDQFSKPSITER